MNSKKLYIALFLILLLGFLIRFQPAFFGSTGGPDTNFHVRMSELVISGQGIPLYDPLSMQGRYYSYAPMYHTTYATLSILSGIPVSQLIFLFPPLYGTIGILVVFIFARKIFKNTSVALFAALALSIMEMHILRTITNSRPDGLALLIIPAIIFLIYLKKYKIAAAVSVFQILLHPLSSIYLISFLLCWIVLSRARRWDFSAKKIFLIIELIVLVWLIWLWHLTPYYSPFDYTSSVSFDSSELAKLSVIDLFVFFEFAWIFILIGLARAKKELFLWLWIFLSFFYGIFGLRLAVFLSIPAAIVAGFGLQSVYEFVMQYKKVFFIILLGLALISVIPRLYSSGKYISDAELDSMLWLKEHSSADENIFSRWDYGHPLTRFAERKVVMDGYFEFQPDVAQRNESMRILLLSSDCSKIEFNAKKWNANYNYLPKKFFSGMDYQTGVLESFNCPFQNAIFDSDATQILKYEIS